MYVNCQQELLTHPHTHTKIRLCVCVCVRTFDIIWSDLFGKHLWLIDKSHEKPDFLLSFSFEPFFIWCFFAAVLLILFSLLACCWLVWQRCLLSRSCPVIICLVHLRPYKTLKYFEFGGLVYIYFIDIRCISLKMVLNL